MFYDLKSYKIKKMFIIILVYNSKSFKSKYSFFFTIKYCYQSFLSLLKRVCFSVHILLIVLANPKKPEKFQLFPNELDENQSISILCSADVGSPLGNIKIWKISQYTNTPVLIHESKATANKPENCTELTDDNFTYSVTRYDNGALFRCSSQNNLIQGPGPSRDSLKISVICLYIYIFSIIYSLSYCLLWIFGKFCLKMNGKSIFKYKTHNIRLLS